MTCEIVFKVNADTRLSPIEKVVFTNIAGGYRTRSEIARVSCCAESSVPRAVRKLEGYGYLKREFVDGKANRYVVIGAQDTGITPDTGIVKTTPSVDTPSLGDTGVSHSTDTPLAVDNHAAPIRNASARGEDNLLRLELEDNHHRHGEDGMTILPPVKVLNGSAKGMPTYKLGDIIAEHVHSRALDPAKTPGLATSHGRIRAWMDAGADFDADILLAVRNGCTTLERKGETAQTWGYFDKIVTQIVARRRASERPLEITNEEIDGQRNHAARAPTGIKPKRNSYTDGLVQGMRGGPSSS